MRFYEVLFTSRSPLSRFEAVLHTSRVAMLLTSAISWTMCNKRLAVPRSRFSREVYARPTPWRVREDAGAKGESASKSVMLQFDS